VRNSRGQVFLCHTGIWCCKERLDPPGAGPARRRRAEAGTLRAVPSVEVQATPRAVFPVPVTAPRCLGRSRPLFAGGGIEVYPLR